MTATTTMSPVTTSLATTIRPRGHFSLAESIDFGFGARTAEPDETVMRLAFVLDAAGGGGLREQAGAAVTQAADGTVQVVTVGGADAQRVTAQVARVLSLDVDATGWDALGARDPLLRRLQAARPGLRPPLFHSAYEAAAWSVLSARRPQQQMAALRDRLAGTHGATFEVAGRPVHAFPTPEQLLAVETFPGLDDRKLQRLHGVARLAADGGLDTEVLAALDPAEATDRVRALDGIGPFYAALVVIRALGHTDVLPTDEPRLLAVLGDLLGSNRPATPAQFAALAEAWSPWRTWAGVAIRAAGPRLLPESTDAGRPPARPPGTVPVRT